MNSLFDLTGKKAIVTGGTRGLGHGMAEGLMEAGAAVVIFGTSKKVIEVAAQFEAKGYWCKGIAVDLADDRARQEAFDQAVALLGGLDILVNAAGIQRRHPSPEFPLQDWKDVLNVNLTAPFDLCQMAAKEFLKKEQPCGKIVNIASMLSYLGGYRVPAYTATKTAVMGLTRALTNEWIAKGINVNAIAPGYIATDMNRPLVEDSVRNQEILSRIPAGGWGDPEAFKAVVVFLASEASDYISGVTLPVDGGFLCR